MTDLRCVRPAPAAGGENQLLDIWMGIGEGGESEDEGNEGVSLVVHPIEPPASSSREVRELVRARRDADCRCQALSSLCFSLGFFACTLVYQQLPCNRSRETTFSRVHTLVMITGAIALFFSAACAACEFRSGRRGGS